MKNLKLVLIFTTTLLLISCGKKLEDTSKKSGNNETNLEQTSLTTTKKNEILNALASNDTNLVKQALGSTPNINFHFENGESPLTFAIKYTKPEIILRLILTKQTLNLMNKDGQLPLNLIIQNTAISRDKKLDLCNQMLKGEVNINKKDANNIAPLLSSIVFNEESIGLYLVKNGADVEAQTTYRISMASFAQRYGLARLESLIRDVSNHKAVDKQSLLQAISDNKTNFLQYLLANFKEYIEIINNENVLVEVLKIQDQAHRLGLLTYFLSIPEITPDGSTQTTTTPLMYAAKIRGDIYSQSVAKLLRRGADISKRDQENKTALIHAVLNINIDIVTRLKTAAIQRFRQNGQIDSQEISEILSEACSYLPTKRTASYINPNNGKSIRFQIGRTLNCF